ncbi:MAG: hypothetical protein KKC39_04395, partial [Candidatus Omnitrophica bacterium]|nr:hypothetical protein [Candidatus Omnitrophota bacterium]MBU4467962.1 hypothetical protein [Candidatus Omnitrophota bacterium]MCG2708612.1 hypothetical protein [Candidatus Omnitrophota bacterium]
LADNKASYSVFTLITGWIAPEWVAGIFRNRWLACNGITGWIEADFTPSDQRMGLRMDLKNRQA